MNTYIRYFLIILFAVSIFLPAYAEDDQQQRFINSNQVNLRKGPTILDPVAGKVDKGTKVEVIDRLGDWFKVKTTKVEGWVFSKYISSNLSEENKSASYEDSEKKSSSKNEDKVASSEEEVTSGAMALPFLPFSPPKQGIVKVSNSQIKYGPDLNFAFYAEKNLKKGDKVDVFGKKGDWLEIQIGYFQGWVPENNVTLD